VCSGSGIGWGCRTSALTVASDVFAGKGAVSPDKDWEMVTSPKDSLLSDQHSMSADDRTKYAEFKKKMDPEKRAEFDRLIAEARDTPARDSHLPDMTNLKAEMSDFEGK
jgi:hypothetical protein